MRRFQLVLLVLTALAHAPFVVAAAFVLARLGAPAPTLSALGAGALGVLLLRGRLRRAFADRPMPRWRRQLVEEPYFAHWSAAVLSLLVFLATAPLLLLHALLAGAAGLGARVGALAVGSYLVGLLAGAYGVLVRRRWVRVRTLDVPVAGLGAAFDGYRIAHLSDLHVGGLWPRESAERWVEAVRALDVDLVALTGDYVTHGSAFHADVVAVLGALRGRDGQVAVLGNHDYFGDAEALVSALRGAGVPVLRNESTRIARGGDALVVAGVDDTWSRRASVREAMAGTDGAGPVIALAHDPQLFPALARSGARVVLAGHTHWGQIAFPFLPTRLNLSRLSYRYHAGLYREGDAVLYVSPGLGTTGPPLRLGAPPEITVIRLVRGAARREGSEPALRPSRQTVLRG